MEKTRNLPVYTTAPLLIRSPKRNLKSKWQNSRAISQGSNEKGKINILAHEKVPAFLPIFYTLKMCYCEGLTLPLSYELMIYKKCSEPAVRTTCPTGGCGISTASFPTSTEKISKVSVGG